MSAPRPPNPVDSPAGAPAGPAATDRRLLAALLVGLALLLFLPAGWRTLWSPDEGRYAEIPREMVATGDWLTPRLDGVKYFEKPPLFYWSTALAIEAFGVNERALRAVPALFALLGVATTIFAARRLWGTNAAFTAGLALGTMPLYFGIANLLAIDMAVSALITVTLLAFLAAAQSTGKQRDLWLLAFYSAAALATLAKGLIGIAIPGMVILAWLSLTGRWRDLLRGGYRMLPGTLVFLVIAAPWHWMVQARNPEWAWFYFVHEHFLRYTTTIHKRAEPFWFYLPVLIFGAFPWSTMIPSAVARWWRERRSTTNRAQWEAGLFCVLWFVLVVGFFSLAGSKLATYVVPALPPLALLLAADASRGIRRGAAWAVAGTSTVLALAIFAVPWFSGGREGLRLAVDLMGMWRPLLALSLAGVAAAALLSWQKPEYTRRLGGGTALMLLVLAAASARYNDERSVKSLATVLAPRLKPGDLVASYQCYPQDLTPYLGRRVAIADWIGELEFGASVEDQSEWLLSKAAFQKRWNGEGTVYVVSEPDDFPGLQASSTRPPLVLAKTRKYVLAVNRSPSAPSGTP